MAAVLFGVANALWALEQPNRGAGATELVRFYEDLSGRIVAGALLSLVSVALFVVFASALRKVLVDIDRDEFFANTAFGGALLGGAAGVGAESINMAAAQRANDGELTEPLALSLFDISYVLGYNAAGIGIGLVALAVGGAALRTGLLMPRWLALISVVLGIGLLTPLSLYLLGPAFVLFLALGVLVLRGSALPTTDPGR